jgi:hypothetical protein
LASLTGSPPRCKWRVARDAAVDWGGRRLVGVFCRQRRPLRFGRSGMHGPTPLPLSCRVVCTPRRDCCGCACTSHMRGVLLTALTARDRRAKRMLQPSLPHPPPRPRRTVTSQSDTPSHRANGPRAPAPAPGWHSQPSLPIPCHPFPSALFHHHPQCRPPAGAVVGAGVWQSHGGRRAGRGGACGVPRDAQLAVEPRVLRLLRRRATRRSGTTPRSPRVVPRRVPPRGAMRQARASHARGRPCQARCPSRRGER